MNECKCPGERPEEPRGPVADALVVGGGLAGSALALKLARSGRSVVLLEKSAAAHPKVCGEFLSHEALHYLSALGVEPLALGAVPIHEVRLARKRILARTPLPFAALSLSRERLDEALLILAEENGVDVRRSHRVQSLVRRGPCWQAASVAGVDTVARAAFLASGKHDLHGWNRPPGRQRDLIAFKMYFRLDSAQQKELGSSVELILFEGGYAGLQPVEGGMTNLCLLVCRNSFRKTGGSWPSLLAHMERHAPHLAVRLDGAIALWERPLSLSSIPYGLVRADTGDELWRLGDQSAVIPSFAGDGMSIALHSARLAAQIYSEGGGARAYQIQLAQEVRGQVGLATFVSRLLVRLPQLPTALARTWPAGLAVLAGRTRIRPGHLLG